MSDPTNCELLIMLENVEKHLVEIKEQTTKTNGRVTKLEKGYYILTGGLVVVGAIVVPLFLKMVTR